MQQMFKPTVGFAEWVVCFLVELKTVFQESSQVAYVPRNHCQHFLQSMKACNPPQNQVRENTRFSPLNMGNRSHRD